MDCVVGIGNGVGCGDLLWSGLWVFVMEWAVGVCNGVGCGDLLWSGLWGFVSSRNGPVSAPATSTAVIA